MSSCAFQIIDFACSMAALICYINLLIVSSPDGYCLGSKCEGDWSGASRRILSLYITNFI